MADMPSLPVPALSDTLERLVESCVPLGSPEELAHLRACVASFESGDGKKLQALLLERAESSRNWMEEWWLTFIYLRPRWPIAVWSNYLGANPNNDIIPYGPLTQVQSAGLQIVLAVQFRKMVDSGRLPVEKLAGRPLCMDQYKNMFSCCRIPGVDMDAIETYTGSTHAVVLRNDCILRLEVCTSSGDPLPLSDMMHGIAECIQLSSNPFDMQKHPAVSTLTSEERTHWAHVRSHMMKLSSTNAESLRTIESALFCIVLDRASPATLQERASLALCGDGHNKWYDKPMNIIVWANGHSGLNGEHSWADAMVVVRESDFVIHGIADYLVANGAPQVSPKTPTYRAPALLKWELDAFVLTAIEQASGNIAALASSISLDTLEFQHFGRKLCKRLGVNADFFVQMAIQLAYWRTHRTPVATYETAHTRLFHHGRTETIRSCSVASVEFCRAMEGFQRGRAASWTGAASADSGSGSSSSSTSPTADDAATGAANLESSASAAAAVAPGTDAHRYALLSAAIASHESRVKDAMMGAGIDRHLLGLQIAAELEGMASPAHPLFTDPLFMRSRRFALSTSNVSTGNSESFGGYAPFFSGGYGVCYSIRDSKLFANITCVRGAPLGGEEAHTALPPKALLQLAASARHAHGGVGRGGAGSPPLPITDTRVLRDAIETALLDMQTLCLQQHEGMRALAAKL